MNNTSIRIATSYGNSECTSEDACINALFGSMLTLCYEDMCGYWRRIIKGQDATVGSCEKNYNSAIKFLEDWFGKRRTEQLDNLAKQMVSEKRHVQKYIR